MHTPLIYDHLLYKYFVRRSVSLLYKNLVSLAVVLATKDINVKLSKLCWNVSWFFCRFRILFSFFQFVFSYFSCNLKELRFLCMLTSFFCLFFSIIFLIFDFNCCAACRILVLVKQNYTEKRSNKKLTTRLNNDIKIWKHWQILSFKHWIWNFRFTYDLS